MNKVTVEITSQGWEMIVQVGEKRFKQQGMRKEPARITHVVDEIEDAKEFHDDLYEALNSFFPFDVAQALQTYEEENEEECEEA